ncbi:MAG: helix-turn-helix transcriptional regulator [Lachnospiraceae bacterium]|nr:helix-turn-helix transcriptional regulator [Lachnospiraceae bacterium]
MKKDSRYFDMDLRALDMFFLAVGGVDDYRQFAVTALKELRKLIAFDQAVAVFTDASGKVVDFHLNGVQENWGYAYLEYYARIQAQFSLGMNKERSCRNTQTPIEPITWAELPDNRFIADCIHTRGLRHSLDLPLYDNLGHSRLVLAMDRTRKEPYSERDVDIINLLAPHLNNMHRKFFLISGGNFKINSRKDALMEMGALTKREKEVVSCLCEGAAPADIGEILQISQATAYRHIANIYKKLHVNNLQELLLRFLV